MVVKEANRLDAVSDVVEDAVVNGLAHVLGGPLGVGGRDDLVLATARLVRGKNANLTTGDLVKE